MISLSSRSSDYSLQQFTGIRQSDATIRKSKWQVQHITPGLFVNSDRRWKIRGCFYIRYMSL